MKIVIKCKGLSIRTKDLGMGLSVLNRIANNGIMKHSFIPNSLLDKAIMIIESVSNRIASLNKKMNEEEKEVVSEETEGVKDLSQEEFVERISDRQKPVLINPWTIDEDKIICDMIDKSPDKVSSNRELRKRHTANAIKTRLSIFRHHRFERLSSDRAKLIEAYLSGEKVSTSVADINKHVPTPIVDKIEKDLEDGKNLAWIHKKKRRTFSFKNRWTKQEEKIISDNANIKAKDIAKLLSGRTENAVLTRRLLLLKRGKIKDYGILPVKVWTEEEDDAIRLNSKMNPKKLSRLPWLKNRTLNAISQRRYKLSKGE